MSADAASAAPPSGTPAPVAAPKGFKRSSEDGQSDSRSSRPKHGAMPILAVTDNFVNLPFRREDSTFIPSFHFAGRVISLMCDNMTRDYLLMRNHPDFHPARLHIYLGTLWIIQILKVNRDTQAIDPYNQFILDVLAPTGILDARIPGPMVPFFRALAAGHPTQATGFGKIVPVLPDDGYIAQNEPNDAVSDQWLTILPPIGILRQNWNRFLAFKDTGGNAPATRNAAVEQFNADPTQQNRVQPGPVPFDNASNVRWTSYGRLAPGCQNPMRVPTAVFKEYSDLWTITPIRTPSWPVTQAGDPEDSLYAYLGLRQFKWFVQLMKNLEWVSEVWTDSARLSDIPTIGISSGQYISEIRDEMANDNSYRDANGSELDYLIRTETPNANVDEVAQRLAAFSVINARFPAVFGPNPGIGRARQQGTTLTGPFWDREPDLVHSNTVNITLELTTNLAKMRR